MGGGEEINQGLRVRERQGGECVHCLEIAPAVKLDSMAPKGIVSPFPCPKTSSLQVTLPQT